MTSSAASGQPVDDSLVDWDSTNKQRITVKEGGGFLYNINLRAKVDTDPADVYDILTDPQCTTIFRSIKECIYRRTLEDDGKGRRKLEIGHRAHAKFAFISVTFDTHLHVWEDDVARTIRFQVAREGMMKRFEGKWNVDPFTQEALDKMHAADLGASAPPPAPIASGWFGASALSNWQKSWQPAESEAMASFVTLEQNLLPRAPVPFGIKALVRGLCAKQCKDLMDDVRTEVQKRKDGISAVPSKNYSARAARKTSGHRQSSKPNVASPQSASAAACLSLAPMPLLWDLVTPIEIHIEI